MLSIIWKWILNLGIEKLLGGIAAAAALCVIVLFIREYKSQGEQIVILERDNAALTDALNESRQNALRDAKLHNATIESLTQTLERRANATQTITKVVTRIKYIERPDDEYKDCPIHPAIIGAFEWVRVEQGTANHNGTQNGGANSK